MSKTYSFAKDFASKGLRIFPVIAGDKRPATSRGFKDATTDLLQVSKWFGGNEKRNIGIATGSGFAVIDVDPKNGGTESIQKMIELGLNVHTMTVRTGGGGFHYYYKTGRPVSCMNGLLPGIDIKGDGGYVVAPPSVHKSGNCYEFQGPLQGVETWLSFPYDLVEKIKDQRKTEEKSEFVAEGGRHDYLVSQLGRLRGLGIIEESCATMIHQENLEKCRPPLSHSEVEQILASLKERTSDEVIYYAPYTDIGNGERFKTFYNKKALFIEKMDRWFIYDGKRYCEDTGSQIVQMAKHLLRHSKSIADKLPQEKANKLHEHLKKSESLGRVTAMLTMAHSEMSENANQLDRDDYLFNVQNGTVNLRTGKIRPHEMSDKITKISSGYYDQNAKCPVFEKFLNEITGHCDETKGYLQRVVGYCLAVSTKEQCLWILYGHGSNGKTTFIEILKKLFGEYSKSADISTFTLKQSEQIRNDLARLYDTRFVTSVEIQEGKSLDESIIKQVTGGDPVTARYLFKEYFEYIPKWKLFLAVNHLPHVHGTDVGMWRRLKVIPFLVQFDDDKKDKDLPQKLEQELPGILNWAIQGCLDWQRGGLKEPQVILEAGEQYKFDQDGLGDFLSEHTLTGTDYEINATDLFQRFSDYQKDLGQRVMSQKLFAQKLQIKGFKKKRGIQGRTFYLGLKLKPWERSGGIV